MALEAVTGEPATNDSFDEAAAVRRVRHRISEHDAVHHAELVKRAAHFDPAAVLELGSAMLEDYVIVPVADTIGHASRAWDNASSFLLGILRS